MIPGTRGEHGSSASESNHSSVLVYFNDGDKHMNTYCEQPITIVKDLFKRQQRSINKFNEMLFGHATEQRIELHRLQQTKADEALINACKYLCYFHITVSPSGIND